MRAFVLGGGGARGALQVGALRALLEAGLQPDLLVGTSVGAMNATYVAVNGFSAETLAGLEEAWHDAARADLLPDSYLWLTIRTLFNRSGSGSEPRIREFCVDHGLRPDLCFGQLKRLRLILVAADLDRGCAALYGTDANQLVLSGLLASTAIPPWVRPLTQNGGLLMDGGVVSNLPIEPALSQGASEIIALDLTDPRPVGPAARGLGPFLFQLISTIECRQIELEKQLAAARRVPVHHVRLRPERALAIWEFPRAVELIEPGYRLMKQFLMEHPELVQRAPRTRWSRFWRRKAYS